jgi:hypothetical protein
MTIIIAPSAFKYIFSRRRRSAPATEKSTIKDMNGILFFILSLQLPMNGEKKLAIIIPEEINIPGISVLEKI